MKVVLDTNVFLSGMTLPNSVPGKIIQAWREGRFEVVLSEPTLAEIERVLSYPKINRRLKWGKKEISRFLLLLRIKAVVVDISERIKEAPAGLDDAHVLATMLAGDAEALVTGDKGLLCSGWGHNIVTPKEFSERL